MDTQAFECDKSNTQKYIDYIKLLQQGVELNMDELQHLSSHELKKVIENYEAILRRLINEPNPSDQ
jgi:uncharacterized protein YfbU (UPF0304 family)